MAQVAGGDASPAAPGADRAAPPRRAAAARRLLDVLAGWAHAIRGSRGLGIFAAASLLLALLEPALPNGPARLALAAPTFLLLVVGLATLPREGVAAQLRVRHLALSGEADAARRLAKHLVWPTLLVILLLPRIFLGAYGIPHLSPLAGLVLPDIQRRIALAFIAVILAVAFRGLASIRKLAPSVPVARPRDMPPDDPRHAIRDVLLVTTVLAIVIWAYMLHIFWQPFSVMSWPPSLASLENGVRGVAAFGFSVAIPAVLFVQLAAYAELWQDAPRSDARIRVLAIVHTALTVIAIALHVYDVLWVGAYQTVGL